MSDAFERIVTGLEDAIDWHKRRREKMENTNETPTGDESIKSVADEIVRASERSTKFFGELSSSNLREVPTSNLIIAVVKGMSQTAEMGQVEYEFRTDETVDSVDSSRVSAAVAKCVDSMRIAITDASNELNARMPTRA